MSPLTPLDPALDPAFPPRSIVPAAPRYDLLLTARAPISHHDPATQDDSNRMLFNRQKQLLPLAELPLLPDAREIDAFCARHPVPPDLAPLFQDVALAEFVAVLLVRLFCDQYTSRNGGEGEGLFSGLARYRRLEDRLRQGATVATSLRTLWDRLCDSLQCSIHPSERDGDLLALFSLARGLQLLAVRACQRDYRSVVTLARYWSQAEREAARGKRDSPPDPAAPVTLRFEAPEPGTEARSSAFEIPAVSGNSLRHQLVREPAWDHLADRLGLTAAFPGRGPVPPGVEAIFFNGGNIAAGAKQPNDPFKLAWQIRAAYPSLDLLGGVTDSFDLGESRLKISATLVCRENRESLRGTDAYDLPEATVSVFDLIDDVTQTRQAGRTGEGQMIYNFETLIAGARILCRFSLVPSTPDLTRGAFLAAIRTYLDGIPTIGGGDARGYGFVDGRWIGETDADRDAERLAAYEAYLEENRDALIEGLSTGKLGAASVVLT